MELQELQAERRTKVQEAKALHKKITPKASDKELRAIESQHDVLMAELDELSDQIEQAKNAPEDRQTQAEREARRPSYAPAEARVGGDMPSEVEADHLEPEQRMADWARRNAPASEYEGLGAGRYLRSLVLGARTDIEKRALTEGTDSAGGFTVPEPVAMELIDLLRAQSVALRAGARTVPLSSDSNAIAKLATDPTPGWRAENAAIAESDPTFTRVLMQPKSLAVLVKASRELLEDSVNIGTELPRVLAAALAKEWDRVALLGSGSANEPTGIANTANIGTASLAAALASYAPLITARTAVKTANAEPTAIIMSPRDEGTLAGLTATDGQPLTAPRQISDLPMFTTTAIPTDGGAGTDESVIFTGDFRHLYLGVRTEIRVEILREAFAANHQYGFVCHMRGDIGVAHAGAFHTTTAVQG